MMKQKINSGFTMVETLVSLVIISIGILGFALLQVESLKAAKTATERSRAIHFATDMMDRIRANKSATADYDTAGVAGPAGNAAPFTCSDPNATPGLNATAAPPACTGTELAAYEIWQWRTMINSNTLGLGNNIGTAGIAVAGTNPWTVTLTIQWAERGENLNYTLTSVIH